MKLICTVAVANRQLSVCNTQKHTKSTLALCKHPNKNTYCLILFNNNNRNGKKYEVNGNISNILTKFLSEGKATIQFKEPPNDFYIQAELIPLQCFLHTLKRILLGTVMDKELNCSSLAVTPVSSKNMPPKKLIINKRSAYPTKGLPRTLEILYINNVDRCSLDIGILRLTKLKILDLSYNSIEFLPAEFGNLPCLCELNLSYNLFGKSSPKQWMWIGGVIAKSLKQLNLSQNDLKFLPDSIGKLTSLGTLNVDHNNLKSLPSSIGNLVNLKQFSAAYNNLWSLPGSIKAWRLHNIDLSHNRLNMSIPTSEKVAVSSLQPRSLKEYAARAVLFHRLHYTFETLPGTLIHYLDLAKFCSCGKACFDVFILTYETVHLHDISKNYTHSLEYTRVPITCHSCSPRCLTETRVRFPFVR